MGVEMYRKENIDEKVRELTLFLCWCTPEQRMDFFQAICGKFCTQCGSGGGYQCRCENDE
jgi:hypothetical protein